MSFGTVLLANWLEFAASASDAPGWSQAAWMAISAQTTAGFSTLSAGELPGGGKLVLIAGMLIGGRGGLHRG